jgi:hypothetical protein
VESDYLFANFLQLSAFNSTDVEGPNRQVRPDREKLIQLILRIYRWNLRPGIIERIRRMHSNARLPHLCEPACVRSIRLSPQTISGSSAAGKSVCKTQIARSRPNRRRSIPSLISFNFCLVYPK